MEVSVIVQNFKSIVRARLTLKSGLNILVGPNASGKTCLLSSLKFLRDLFLLGVAQALAKNGGARRVYRRRKDTIHFSITHDYGERIYKRKKRPCTFSWEIAISQTGPERIATIIYERIRIDAQVDEKRIRLFKQYVDRRNPKMTRSSYHLCGPDEFGRDMFSIWDEDSGEVTKTKLFENFSGRFKELSKNVKADSDISIFPLIAGLDSKLRNLNFLFTYLDEYSISPDIARQSTEQLPFAQMQPNGSGVSEVIDALEKKRFEKIELSRYYGREGYRGYENLRTRFLPHGYVYSRLIRYAPFMRGYAKEGRFAHALESVNKELAIAVRPIESISVETDQTNGRRFVVFNAGDEKFYPEEVSDGTIKWLCILVSIFVPYSTVYLLEEPENFLHPWMQQRLIEIMREHAKINDTIFLLSTHSTTVLNSALPEEVFVVSATDKGTRISKIEKKEEIEEALEESGFRLGDYWISGAIGGVP